MEPNIQKNNRAKNDSAWKEALSTYFKSFMELCWPNIFNQINWEKGYEILEQELLTISEYPSPIGNRLVDKLIKVWKKNGEENWVLVHIEIQAKKQNNFTERLFIYRYRLHDRFRKPVATLAILIDKNPTWRPRFYQSSFWGSSIRMSFPILKLLDFNKDKERLKKLNNPFAIIILAQLLAIETSQKKETRLMGKIDLARLLLKKGWHKNDVFSLYKFLDGILAMPDILSIKYTEEIKRLEQEELNVSYMTVAEEIGFKHGLKEGRKEGRKVGHKEGIREVIQHQLAQKFQSIPESYLTHIQTADNKVLRKLCQSILNAKAIEDVFSHIN